MKIVNLDCGSCAQKIEDMLNKKGLDVTIDYLNESIDIKEEDIKEAQKIINKIEPGVKIIHEDDVHDHEQGFGKLKIILFILTLVTVIIANLTGFTLLYFVAYLMCSYSILYKTFLNLRNKQFFDENFLMTIATISALLIGEYNEAIIILMFFQIGEFFEHVAVTRSKKSIESLMDNRDNNVLDTDNNIVDIKKVKVDDKIIIKPNEVIPLDGVVLNDNVELDESSINGESKTKIYNNGDDVLSGVINTSKQFNLMVTSDYKNSYQTKVSTLIKDAQKNKSNTEKFITKFAKVYTPIVVILALIIMAIQLILGNPLHDSIYTGVIFLVISCPCALVISIPLGYFGGIGLSSRENILVKGSQYLEEALHITDIAFDKTGTITDGKFEIIDIQSNIDKKEFINIVGSSEQNSSHVIARQLVKELEYEDINLEGVTEVTSKGLIFNYNGSEYKVGNSSFTNIDYIKSNYTLVYVTKDENYIGHIEIGDKLREGVKETFKYLKNNNIDTHILSGDNSEIIKSIAKEVDVDNYHGSLMAEDKYDYIKDLRNKEKHVAFIGDGVNDAASIVEADIGIAIGSNANTLAVETSDIVFVNNTPNDLIKLSKIAKKTRNIVYQNMILAFGVKIIFLILATFGLSSIYEAIFADVGVALIAILNSYRLIKMKI